MLEFVKKLIGRGESEGSSTGGRGMIQAIPGGGAIVNLERCWWSLEMGGGGRLVVKSGTGHEVFDEQEHLQGLRGAFLRMGPESPEVRALQATLDHQSPLILVFPSKPRIRGEALDLFDEFLGRRLKAQATDFDLMKIYTAPGRPDGEKFCRKFRGKHGEQVVFNLTGEGLRYLHFDPQVKDVTVDAMEFDWPVTPSAETLMELTESRIRGMDPTYFRRLREGIDAGMLLVFLPESPEERMPVLGTVGRLLGSAPGGPIDLDARGVIRMFRTRRQHETD